MPSGSLSTVDRVKTLQQVKVLLDEGKSNNEISAALGLPGNTVINNIRYLNELAAENLTPEVMGNKRSELYLDLSYATNEAKIAFEKYRNSDDGINAKRFLDAYIQSIIERAKLYGLYASAEAGVTINQQFNNFVPDTIGKTEGTKIANILTKSYEEKVAAKFNEKEANKQNEDL